MKLKKQEKKLRALIPYNKANARRMMNIDYYIAQRKNMRQYSHLEMEKKRRVTAKWSFVSNLLESFKDKGFGNPRIEAAKTLSGIFKKHIGQLEGCGPDKKTTNVLKLVAKPEMLWLAYKRLKGNKGIMTKAANVDKATFDSYSPKQKELFFRKKVTPNGFSLRDVYLTSFLVRKNQYPLGSSRRIWLDKPGDKTKKRPITIPPFMDRLVQESIKMTLTAIWKPEFERMNRSFGFRPKKSCHDAITALKTNHRVGLYTAIERDIQGAYDNIRKEDIIRLLGKKMHDQSFMNFMTNRLNYDYVDAESKLRLRPEIRIPQGGIDSPYLFNIVMLELDKYVHNNLQEYLNELNNKKMVGTLGGFALRTPYKPRRNVEERMKRKRKKIQLLKENNGDKELIFTLQNEVAKERRWVVKHPYTDTSIKKYRLFYVRYADDWILLSNTSLQVAEKLKILIKNFLYEELGAILSEKKTLITDLKKTKEVSFLGFEICARAKAKIIKVKSDKPGYNSQFKRVSTFPLIIKPDVRRLIERLHQKGFCNKVGFPISVPWLTNLEATVIIERFNASIRGLAQYYLGFISNKYSIHRWIYILRFSCLKTLAHKYRSSINKVFKRFGTDRWIKGSKTVSALANIKVGGIPYEKEYKLETFDSLYKISQKQGRLWALQRVFYSKERGEIGEYPICPSRVAITDSNFLERLHWTSVRTQAAFSMPCAVSGSGEQVQMYHLRHIRKQAYTEMKEYNYVRMLALSNRKQIPVCAICHRSIIHAGKYQGPPLKSLINLNDKLVDNRVIHVESFVKPGKEYFSKTLPERGWRETLD